MTHTVLDNHILGTFWPHVQIRKHSLTMLGRNQIVFLATQDQDLLSDVRVNRRIVGAVVDCARVLFRYQLPQSRGESWTGQVALTIRRWVSGDSRRE